MNRRRFKEPVPEKYQVLDYIESTGTQWIDTRYYATHLSTFDIKVAITIKGNIIPFGARNSGTYNTLNEQCYLNTNFIEYNSRTPKLYSTGINVNENWSSGIIPELNTMYEFDNMYVVPTMNDMKYPITLFAFNMLGVVNPDYGICRIGKWVAYNSGIKAANFIPALDPDGRPCMYDTISKQPFYNQGTGEFIAGNATGEIIIPADCDAPGELGPDNPAKAKFIGYKKVENTSAPNLVVVDRLWDYKRGLYNTISGLFIKQNYLTFTAITDGEIGMTHKGTNATTTKPNLSYNKNGMGWITWDYTPINVVVGDMVMFKGTNDRMGRSLENYSTFTSTCQFNASGNIMSILYDDDFINKFTISVSHCFIYLFYNCFGLLTSPELPATTISSRAYSHMFDGCSSLIAAPQLPATNAPSYVYSYMFRNCTNLVSVPEILPATTDLKLECYHYMFANCSNITSAPELPAKILPSKCYRYMFVNCTKLRHIKCLATDISADECILNWVQGVSSTGTFVKDANTEWPSGVSGIPKGWTIEND